MGSHLKLQMQEKVHESVAVIIFYEKRGEFVTSGISQNLHHGLFTFFFLVKVFIDNTYRRIPLAIQQACYAFHLRFIYFTFNQVVNETVKLLCRFSKGIKSVTGLSKIFSVFLLVFVKVLVELAQSLRVTLG